MVKNACAKVVKRVKEPVLGLMHHFKMPPKELASGLAEYE
jgi:hypothetical protein